MSQKKYGWKNAIIHHEMGSCKKLHEVSPCTNFPYKQWPRSLVLKKQAEVLFRLIFCERNTLFRQKNKLKSMDYKPADRANVCIMSHYSILYRYIFLDVLPSVIGNSVTPPRHGNSPRER
jgi:hypothetical protein